ncbi:MAG: JAB domain-containing protein [Lachnospiraceae bacterium]|nr:JAB domain-containing protein [Lachnospiraceae bacterium]
MELKEDLMKMAGNKKKKRIEFVRMTQERVGAAYTDVMPWNSPERVVDTFGPFLGNSAVEYFFAAALNCRAEPAAIQLMGVGGVDSCQANVADILKFALVSNAHSIILVHNHPSGYPGPSREDRTLTCRVEEACQMVGLKLTDHIIIGGDGYGYSIHGETYVEIRNTGGTAGCLDRERHPGKGENHLCTREYPRLA